jgi:hypothetical protein
MTSGYNKEWLADGDVLCYRLVELTMATVDEWAQELTKEFNDWPADRAWRLLLDIRMGGNIVNTYALRRARVISNLRPELPGRLALLVGSKLAGDVITMALRATPNLYRKRQVFLNEAVAIRWLMEATSNPPNLQGYL